MGIIIQKLKKNEIRSRAPTPPRRRACDFPLLNTLQNWSEPNFAFFFSPRSRGTILKRCLQSKVCLYWRFRIFQTLASGFLKAEQIWSLSHLNHPMAFLVSQHILQRLRENTKNWYLLEEMCETIIMKLSNLDGEGDVNSRLNTVGGGMSGSKSKIEAEMAAIKTCSKEWLG